MPRFHLPTRLSEHLAETPEGFLVCRDVPIARVGVQEYAPGEAPEVQAAGQALVRIERGEDEVFAPEAVASFEGKPLTVGHPDEDVTPANWRALAVGHAQNVRRGAGVQSDLLLADIVVTDERAITLVRAGLREVSCGYDAEYEQTGPGRGRQTAIRGNHIALVPRGRCGPRCRITDNHDKEDAMTKMKKKTSVTDRLLDVFRRPEVRKALDEAEPDPVASAEAGAEETAKDEEGGQRLAALEASLAELVIEVRRIAAKVDKPEPGAATDDEPDPEEVKDEDEPQGETGEKAKSGGARDAAPARVRDAATVDSDTRRRAEAMVPGLRVAAADKRCAVQRVALRSAVRDAAVARTVNGVLRGSTLDDCDCVTLDAAFLAASEVAAANNNRRTADGLARASVRDFGHTVTPADINKLNAEFHNKGGK
jgi:hypothetical protein